MSGGTSRARRPKAITLVGLNERMEEFKALPAKLRQQIAGIINEQAKETRADLVQRITADGFSEASVKAQSRLVEPHQRRMRPPSRSTQNEYPSQGLNSQQPQKIKQELGQVCSCSEAASEFKSTGL